MKSQWHNEREVLIKAGQAAYPFALSLQDQLASIRVDHKRDRSPVTAADYAIQALLTVELKRHLPDIPIVAEESLSELDVDDATALTLQQASRHLLETSHYPKGTSLQEVLTASLDAPGDLQTYWTLDPIDGTKGFVVGEDYAIALSLIHNAQPVLGLLICPHSNPRLKSGFYIAERNGGAQWLSPDLAVSESLRVSHPGKREDIRFCTSVAKGHSNYGLLDTIQDQLQVRRPAIPLHGQGKYALVASGTVSAYLKLPTAAGYIEKIWDHAAGQLLVAEAGGTVTDVQGLPLRYGASSELRDNQGVVASCGNVHQDILDLIERHTAPLSQE